MIPWRVGLQPLILCLILFGVVSGTQIYRTDQTIRAWTFRTLGALSEALSGVARSGLSQVYGSVGQKIVQLEGWAGLTLMPDNVVVRDVDGWIRETLFDLKRQMDFVRVDCLTEEGVCIASTEPTTVTTGRRPISPYAEAFPLTTTVVGPVEAEGRTVLILASPIWKISSAKAQDRGRRRPIAYLRAMVDWNHLTDTVFGTVRSSAVGGKSESKFVVFDDTGTVLASSTALGWKSLSAVGLSWALLDTSNARRTDPVNVAGGEFAAAAAQGWTFHGSESVGKSALWKSKGLAKPKWGFLVLQPSGEAIGATGREARRERIVLILHTLAIVLVLFVILIWRFVVPTMKVAAFTQMVRGGGLDIRLRPVGGSEFKILVNSINEMLDRQERARVELMVMQRELAHREKLSSLGRLAAGLAHEIRNPLAVVKFAATYLRKHTVPVQADRASKIDQSWEDIFTDLARIGNLIDDLLIFSKPPVPTPDGLDVGELLDELKAHFEKRPEVGSVELTFEKDAGLPRARGTKDPLMRTVLNLCMNALEAMEGKGSLKVRASLETVDDKSWVTISVTDSGPGIAQDNLERIFEPFFTTKKRGTGLGLYICDQTVRGMEGVLKATSTQGQGSTFVVRLSTVPASKGS